MAPGAARVGTLLPVVNPPSDLEARLAALEARVEEVAADAATARHLAAARDRDLAGLGVKVDANRAAINALGQQTAGRFAQLEQRVDAGFAEMRGKLDQAAAGQQQIRRPAHHPDLRAGRPVAGLAARVPARSRRW